MKLSAQITDHTGRQPASFKPEPFLPAEMAAEDVGEDEYRGSAVNEAVDSALTMVRFALSL
ncbi:MAG: hypothetical protein RBS88_09170, partial [Spongiibacteraceae bacterium]|nr:hypothetical protein [Spongiibacteraceae bacterium]